MPNVELVAQVFNMKLPSGDWLRDKHAGEVVTLRSMEDCEMLIRLNMAKPVSEIPKAPDPIKEGSPTAPNIPAEMLKPEEPRLEETPKEIDSRFIAWLEQQGFARAPPEGTAFSKTDKLETGKIVKLIVDFKDNPHGNRYGLYLDERGGWKTDEAMRDHPDLLEFKHYRDELLTQDTSKPENREITKEEKSEKVVPGGEGQSLMLEMEAKDEEQIIKELSASDFLKREIVKQLFYSFRSGERTVVGLSYLGVKALALKKGNIHVKDLEQRETEKSWIVICKAADTAKNIEVYGVAVQPKEMALRNGAKVPDAFALVKAVSKSQRNAIKFLLPAVVIEEAYKQWLEEQEA